MHVTCVTIYVKPENVGEFIRATEENRSHSINEPENLRFDFLQCADSPARFFLYEAYRSESGAKAHRQTEHYLKWRETVAPFMEKPREGVVHSSILPTEEDEWKTKRP